MDLIDAVKAIGKTHEEDVLAPLTTVWGDALDKEKVLSEYPRPQFVRNSYMSLNGTWEYAITGSDTFPEKMDGDILVPFSPEAALSGVGRQLKPGEYLWYRRQLPPVFMQEPDSRVLLHFGAIDQRLFLSKILLI